MPYPELEDQLRNLVAEHITDQTTPLLLAVYFRSTQYLTDDCVFEVQRDFGFNQAADDRRIFQMSFGRSADLDVPVSARIRLFLTSPYELFRAAKESWPDYMDVHSAVRNGQFKILFQSKDDNNSIATLHSPFRSDAII